MIVCGFKSPVFGDPLSASPSREAVPGLAIGSTIALHCNNRGWASFSVKLSSCVFVKLLSIAI